MKLLLRISSFIDTFNKGFAILASIAVILSCTISAGNAVIRYFFDTSSNAWLEVQWYLFTATVMLGAAYVFKENEHVRVDIFYGRFSPHVKAWIDIFGILVFLIPSMYLLMKFSWPIFYDAYIHHEMSSNAGGLIRWPAKLLMPVGFALLGIQALSELIKRIALLSGQASNIEYVRPLQ